MDSHGFNLVVRAMCGGESPKNAEAFAGFFLQVLEAELEVLRDALCSDEPDVKNAGHAVYYMAQRVELARDLLEQLRQKGAA